jgi:hypothetical protein
MTTAIATPINQIKLTPGSAMIISGLTWKTYEALLQDLGDNRYFGREYITRSF